MQMKASKKNILIYLLLCSLFLTSYISVLGTNGIIPADLNLFNRSSINEGEQSSAMNGGINAGHFDFTATTDSSREYSILSMKQWRWPAAKSGFNPLSALIAALFICLIYAAKRSEQICTSSFCSLKITVFLHKKDGMK